MVDREHSQQAVSEKAAEDLRKSQEDARKDAAAGVDARLAARDKQVAEYYTRHEDLQPTPTQRENDLARVGALDVDNKEDDGSEWEDDHMRRVAVEKIDNPYVAPIDADEPHAGRTRKGGRKSRK